jgi:EpsI family protein
LVAAQSSRVEPITYWIIIGDKVPASSTARKIEQLKYGLTGKVPDGLLFRISSISTSISADQDHAFNEQAGFINELLKGVSQEARVRLIGKAT